MAPQKEPPEVTGTWELLPPRQHVPHLAQDGSAPQSSDRVVLSRGVFRESHSFPKVSHRMTF